MQEGTEGFPEVAYAGTSAMIVSSLDGEDSPAYGVAEKVLGRSKQSCGSGHTIWHSALAWKHSEQVAIVCLQAGSGDSK